MSYISGDLTEVFVSHPEFGEHRFAPKANESWTIIGGGVVSNDDENGITGNGQMIDQMNMTRWSAEGSVSVNLVTDKDSEMIRNLSSSPILATWTLTHISGAVYQGIGKPVGAHEIDTNTALCTLKISGGGKLSKIG